MKIEQQKRSKKYMISMAVLISMVVLTCYIILDNNNINHLVDTIQDSDIRYVLLAMVMVLIHIVSEGYSMRMIGKILNDSFSIAKSILYSCIDLFYCGITPSASGGEPVLAFYMAKDGIAISHSSIILLVYTILYKVALLALGVFALAFHSDLIFQHGTLIIVFFVIGILINIGIIAVCFFSMFSTRVAKLISMKVVQIGAKLHIVKDQKKMEQKLAKQLEEYHASAIFLKDNFKSLVKVFFVVVIQRIAFFSVGYLVYRSFGLNYFNYFDILALQVVISITVDTLPIPGAVGVTEGVFLILNQVVYSEVVLTSAMIMTRGITFYFCLVVCGLATAYYHLKSVRRERHEGR